MTKRVFFLFAVFLLAVATICSGAEIDRPEEAPSEDVETQGTAEENQFQPADESWMNPLVPQSLAEPEKVPQADSSCYIGCYSVQQSASFCPSGQIAEVLVSGPINGCKLGDLRCKPTCYGPVVSCNGFTYCP